MKKITAALLGAGGRGNVYSTFAKTNPEEFEVVAVAEPDEARRKLFCETHQIPPERTFECWQDLLAQPKLADAMLICTMDDMHTAPAVQSLQKGYHVLLEKPMAITEADCEEIGRAAEQSGLVLAVCHVLRYTPFYSTLKKLIEAGEIGELLSMQQTEGVGYWHQAHSFVRGNWRNSASSSSMILQKCCHDLDIISWLIGSKCTHVASFGALTHFKAENAPEGAPAYCLDGCPHEKDCLYYAPRFYLEHPRAMPDGFAAAVTTDTSREGILSALKTSPYGRCVYHCDNDVVDHQVVEMTYENTAVASLIMTAFTKDCSRALRIFGTHGEIFGNMESSKILLQKFDGSAPRQVEIELPNVGDAFHHSGGDYCIIRDFVAAVREGNANLNRTTAGQSLQSHRICFAAERSRLARQTIKL